MHIIPWLCPDEIIPGKIALSSGQPPSSPFVLLFTLSNFSLFLLLLDFFFTAQTFVIHFRCSLFFFLFCCPVHCLRLHCLCTELARADQILGATVYASIFISHKYLIGCCNFITKMSHQNDQTPLCNILPTERGWITEKLSNVVIKKVGFSSFGISVISLPSLSTLDTSYRLYQNTVLGCLWSSLMFVVVVRCPKPKASSAGKCLPVLSSTVFVKSLQTSKKNKNLMK